MTANNATKVYGSANPAFTGAISGLQNSDNISATYTTLADVSSPVGTYDITAILADPDTRLGNYLVTTNTGTLTVTPALLTVTADNQTKVYGAANPSLTATIVSFVNADTEASAVTGSATLNTAVTTTTGVGNYAITANIGTLTAPNYTFGFSNGILSVTPALLTGTANNQIRLYGQTNPVFTATYNGFVNSETESVLTGTLSGSTSADTNSPVGMYAITVSGQSAANYNITYVAGTLSVTPAPVLVTPNDESRAYGQTNPVFTATITGLVNGEPARVLDGTLVLTTSAETNSPIGTYPIEASGLTTTNYSLTFSNGTLTITPFALVVTADNQSKAYGSANPALTGTLTGVQNGDNITATYATSADTGSGVGAYPILATLVDPDGKLTNYSTTINNGSLTVNPAALSVTADNQTKTYGQANPTLTGTLTGVQNDDNITASYATSADTSSGVGAYPILATLVDPDGRLTNYSATINNGSLTVNPAPLSVTADNQTKIYGEANPSLTGLLTGVQNGDNITATYATAADNSSGVGSYPVLPTLVDPDGKLANYNPTINNGALAVTPAALIGTADNKVRLYGQPNLAFTVTYSGFVNSENSSVVTGALLASTGADINSPVGICHHRLGTERGQL